MFIFYHFFEFIETFLAFMSIYDEFYRTSIVSGPNCDKFDKTSMYFGLGAHYYRYVAFSKNVLKNLSQIK